MKGLYLIAAVGADGGIGAENQLLWHLKADMEHFRQMTTGHPVIMGGKTFRSIGQPLKNRQNIVLTSSQINDENVVTCSSLDELKEKLEGLEKPLFVIGGASLYQAFLPEAEKLYLTEIEAEKPAEVFFPAFERNDFRRRELNSGEEDGVKYTICEYTRKAYDLP